MIRVKKPARRLITASSMQLGIGMPDPALKSVLPQVSPFQRMQGGVRENGGVESLSNEGEKMWSWESQASSVEEAVGTEGPQHISSQDLPLETTHKGSKPTPLYLDFKHKNSNGVLWFYNSHEPRWDAWMKGPPESAFTSIQGQAAFGRLAAHVFTLEASVCKKLCEDGRIVDAVDALNVFLYRGGYVSTSIFFRLLKRCIAIKDLPLGRRIHALIIKSGFDGDAFLATQLIGLYALHGMLEDAMGVFTKVSTPSTYNWASIIFAYARHGEAAHAMRLYHQMRESIVQPDNRIYSAVLKACAVAGDLVAGKEVHAHILASPVKPDIYVQTGLLDMYAKCRSLKDARRVFDELPERNVVTWNAMLAGYTQQGMGQEALNLYNSMQQEGHVSPSSITFICLLQACVTVGVAAFHLGKQLHAQIEERGLLDDVVVGGSLVSMHTRCGSLEDARSVFDMLPHKNVVTWTAMMSGYAVQGMGHEALSLHNSMQLEGLSLPDSLAFACLLHACAGAGVGALHQGKQLHAQLEERGMQDDVLLGGSLVNMYVKCGSLGDARSVFGKLVHKNVVTWNVMLAGYSQEGMGEEALSIYSSLQQEGITSPDALTFAFLLQACAAVGGLRLGKQLHAQIEEQGLQADVVVGMCLIDMYAKCDDLKQARSVFDRLPDKNVGTWNAMFSGYTMQGMGQDALGLYSSMQQEGITPNAASFVCLLDACAIVAALPVGKRLHAQIEELGLHNDVVVGSALVNMYAKCGSMSDSQQVFDSLPERPIEAWGALTDGYSRQADSDVVFHLFDRMRLAGIHPDGIMFLSVLTVCSHMGLVDKGRRYFEAMSTDYGISPNLGHYRCMMDILGRAGHLDQALWMAKAWPFPPNGVVWRTLLGACQKWNNVEIGQQAFEYAVSLDSKDATPYVLMSNIYASAEMWKEAQQVQARRVQCGAWKKPGQSWWIDVGGVVYTFLVGNSTMLSKN